MNRALTFGLALMAASSAPAWGSGSSSVADGGVIQCFMGASSAASAHGVVGYLGVDVRDIPSDQLPNLKLRDTHGAEIILVDHDAPAGKAGLREHDVVLQMNGQAIDGQDQFRRLLHDSPPGRTITLLVSRDGQQLTITTQMANREEVERQAWENHLTVPEPQASPVDAADSGDPAPPASTPAIRGGNSFLGSMLMSPSYTGAMLEKMSIQLADFFGVPSGTGLLVRSVQPNSPAALAGMHAGDVVVRASDRDVTTTSDWAKAIKNSHGKPLTIVVMRDKKEETLTLTPDGKRRSSLEPPDQNADGTLLARMGFSWMH